jgi:glucose/arabinose dehydrogenase
MRPSPWELTLTIAGLAIGVGACGGDDSTFLPGPPVAVNPDASVGQPGGNGGSGSVEPGEDAGVIPPPVLDAGVLQCQGPSGPAQALKLTPVASGFDQPLYVGQAPEDDDRLFVLEQPGIVKIVRDGQILPEPFLDLTAQVRQDNSEDGIVGLAFHRDYRNNRRLFIHYVTEQVGVSPEAGTGAVGDAGGQAQPVGGLFIEAGASIISEFRVSDDPDRAEPGSERRLLVVRQPFTNHNGGMLAFSPLDNMLYVGLGDGGSAGDPTNGAQDLTRLTGKMLRIDVDSSTDGLPYGIPPGNMTGPNVRPEIWSYGWRNPWRYSFDPCNGDMYIGDVGQYRIEEVDYEPANTPGRNYGWNIMEGDICYPAEVACDSTGTVLPVLTYFQAQGACAVISGYVYRGQNIPSLRGAYLYADYCLGTFGSFRMQDGVMTELRDITADLNPTGLPSITSFGVDNQGEIYVVAREGTIFRIDPE